MAICMLIICQPPADKANKINLKRLFYRFVCYEIKYTKCTKNNNEKKNN